MACYDLDYASLRDLVLSESTHAHEPSRNALFDTRLTAIAQLGGVLGIEDLLEGLRVDDSSQLHSAVAEAITINETKFFRDTTPFQVLRDNILPQLIEGRQKQRRLRIWSAGCSTGQEPYSIAMLLCQYFPQIADWDVRIVGTDISRRAIHYAERGRYCPAEVEHCVSTQLQGRFFERVGDSVQIAPEVQALCAFHHADLCVPSQPSLPQFDLILMRNVLLYLPPPDRSRVLAEVHRQIHPDGYLVLGSAEQAEDSTDRFKAEVQEESYFYRPVKDKRNEQMLRMSWKQNENVATYRWIDLPAATPEPYTGFRAIDGEGNFKSGTNSAEKTGAAEAINERAA